MARNFDNVYDANVIGLWDFRPGDETADTGLDDGIAQDGTGVNAPGFEGGWLLTNGCGQRFDTSGTDAPFDIAAGTIITEFRQFAHVGKTPDTIVSRGEANDAANPDEGFFEIRVTKDGAVEAFHTNGTNTALLSTGAGFFDANDVIKATYSWSPSGPTLLVENVTQGTSTQIASDEPGLTMDLTDDDGDNFTIAAREYDDDQYNQYFNGAIDYVAVLDKPVLGQGDGVVEGTAGDDLIDLAYDGDPEGDMIDAGDAILPGQGPDDDIVDAGAGNDTIYAGEGDDTVYAGSGDDTIHGGAGNDTIYGDSNLPGGKVNGTVRESFEWDQAPDPDGSGALDSGDDLSSGFTQDTGNVTVTFSVESSSSDPETEFSDQGQYVTNINTGGGLADQDSALAGKLNCEGDSATYKLEFSTAVRDVSFRINDIDGNGVARVKAFDLDGNPIEVNMSNAPNLTVTDEDGTPGRETAISKGGYADPNNPGYSVLVTIPGPVGRIEITHEQDGPVESSINVTDIFYDVPLPDPGEHGNDLIYGGDGDDIIYGEGGNDTIHGGVGDDYIDGGPGDDLLFGDEGNDTIYGGAGNDTISGGTGSNRLYGGDDRDTFTGITQGDFIDGGEGYTNDPGDDYDTLDLTGAAEAQNPGGSLRVDYDSDNPENGTVTFFDADGAETGTTRFVNIENIIVPCFTPGTLIATPKGERRVEDLRIGDRVITRDNGIQEIRWVGARTIAGEELAQAEHLRPVLIQAGALGNGLPERDMMVSPNHRILIANDKTALYFEEREVLVAAKHLTGLEGVDIVQASNVTYIHFMFHQHEVVLSDGAWTESFQPGDSSLQGVGNAQRTEIFELFPELKTREGLDAYQSARRSLKKHEARLLM